MHLEPNDNMDGHFSGMSVADRMGSYCHRLLKHVICGSIHLYENVLSVMYSTTRVFLLANFLMFVASLMGLHCACVYVGLLAFLLTCNHIP